MMKKRGVVLALISVVLVVSLVLVSIFVIVPNSKYKKAAALRDSGDLTAAYEMFLQLEDHKDSAQQSIELKKQIDYNDAVELLDQGKTKEGYLSLSKNTEFEKAAELMEKLEEENSYLSLLLEQKGGVITLGEYEQDNNTSNGKEPIDWIVINNGDGSIYLLSKYVLDVKPFNSTNAKDCDLDDWLKTTFYEKAFNSEEKELVSRIELLRETDISEYSLKNEDCFVSEYTAYALTKNPFEGYASGLTWWLTEEELFTSNGEVHSDVVGETGVTYATCVTDRCGVRPAIWLFADPETLPAEYEYDGSVPEGYVSSGGGSSTKCSRCGGTGKIAVKWYSQGDHGEVSYTSSRCSACGGDGRR